MSDLSFKDRVVIISGAGGGLGKAYSHWFGDRGAKVLVNDLSKENADAVVAEIKAKGKGDAIANYDSVTEGTKIVDQVIQAWGRVDVIVNNAGILRDKSFKAMSDQEWDLVHLVHVKGAFKLTHAAWPHFRKQKFGRVINTSSAAGIYGNFGQANYSAAKFGLVGFTRTLAREGEKYNIRVNAIAPVAASPMTATVMPPDMLENLSPEKVAPFVLYLCHESSEVTGGLFELGAGWYGALRWERSKGKVFRTDDSYSPSSIKAAIDEIHDFENPDFPTSITDADHLELLERSKEIKENPSSEVPVRFDDQVVLVTGAGAGLGKAYAEGYAKLGAKVVVNDFNKEAADAVVKEIAKNGGQAVAAVGSVENGEALVKAAVDAYGTIHVVVNNAGILRDKSFAAMTEQEWDAVYNTHMRGTYAVCHAAWPYFLKQKYGRILNTTSPVGLYGNFGQANYSTAKAGIIGFTNTLSIEGAKYNILANVLAPNAGTAMTATIWPEELVKAFSPKFIFPTVGYLTSQDNEEFTHGIYEVSGGWVAVTRQQRAAGYAFPVNKDVTPEDIAAKFDNITLFDDRASNPGSTQESLMSMVENFGNQSEESDDSASSSEPAVSKDGYSDFTDKEDPEVVAEAKKQRPEPSEFTYDERDVTLYNLGIGAKENELDFVYEGAEDFQAIPTFGVIPPFAASSSLSYDFLPNFSPMMLLHGEQYLQVHKPIPTSGTLVNKVQLVEALDKGKAAAVTSQTNSFDKASGDLLFTNQMTVFIRGSGNFNGKKTGSDRGPATAANKPPNRAPDAVVEETTLPQQAAIYRLSGDYNPLHIDPSFAAVGGFKKPILHGLCTFGISGKHVYKTYGPFKDIKVRFAGVVYPGETVVTSLWKEGNKVIFETKIKERDVVVLSNAAATLP